MNHLRHPPLTPSATLGLLRGGAVLLALLAAGPSQALYKVIGPDGKVTYTDREPAQTTGKVTALGARAAVTATEVALPAELRAAATRYPVTLYVSTGACEPCDAARALLRQRGIPHLEKQVLSGEDGDALQKLTGGRDAPTLTIGAQSLRGLANEVWNSYLDSAGYPRESKLPVNYQFPAATPLTERRVTAPAAEAAPAAPATPAAPPAAPVTTPGIKF